MSTVISVENLSKRYILSHEPRERYVALRDVIADGVKSLGRRLAHPFAKRAGSSAREEFWALKDVSFKIKDGERLGVIGRNGAGKSTLLKILSRITEPTSGRIEISGRVASLLEVGTGFHPELTGRQNVFLNGAILGMTKAEILRKFDEIVAFAEIEKFLDTPVKRYSSGMYVRLAFAVAAHLEPEILVVDEVLAVGDAQFQKKCLGKMQDISSQGRTVIFVSHNMGAIMSLCTRAIMLSAGQIAYVGEPADAVVHYLSESVKKKATAAYPVDPRKDIQVLTVTLKDSSGQSSAYLDLLQPFRIELEYLVHREVSGAVISCAIHDQYGDCIIATADHDMDRTKLGRRSLGHNRTHVDIPGHLLNSGIFNLVIGISMPGKYIYDRREAFSFELFDSGSFVVNGGGEERRNSLLLLPLHWDQ